MMNRKHSEQFDSSLANVVTPARTNASVVLATYRNDPMFPQVERAVLGILATSKVVTPVNVLIDMSVLQSKALEDWRFGRVPYLEQVIKGNLSKLRRFLRILGLYCHDLNLRASHTAYVRLGKGPRLPLRFTKTGEHKLEQLYANHFVWPGTGPFHVPQTKRAKEPSIQSP